jgi:hypothetical protein|tara:strand:+ start:186 stop:644 length:459 start_codon:yes stop_codon:yes gene_type:complete
MLKKLKRIFNKNKKIDVIPEHESPVRNITSKAHGTPYKPIKDFEEAKKYDDSYMVMEGDWGGQIYLSIPVKKIKCNYNTLKNLLNEIDKKEWECNEGDGSGIYFERKNAGEGITGGIGGGVASENLWVHEDLDEVKNKIFAVLNGKSKSINE